MPKYFPVNWTNEELIAQLDYERSMSPLIDNLCKRFEDYLKACDIEMITLELKSEYETKLKTIGDSIIGSSECPICNAQLSLYINPDVDTPLNLIPYVKLKKGNIDSSVTVSSLSIVKE